MNRHVSEVELLRYQVAELKSVLGQNRRADFNRIFKLSPMECDFLGLLISRELVSRENFFAALYSDTADAPCEHIPNVMLSHIRKKLKPFGINVKNRYGFGWFLFPEDKKLIAELCR
jgi:hypothetical protein